jgi:hypothetical protein
MHTKKERNEETKKGGELRPDGSKTSNSTCEFPSLHLDYCSFIHSLTDAKHLPTCQAQLLTYLSASLSLSLERPGMACMHAVYLVFLLICLSACPLGFFRIISTRAHTHSSIGARPRGGARDVAEGRS